MLQKLRGDYIDFIGFCTVMLSGKKIKNPHTSLSLSKPRIEMFRTATDHRTSTVPGGIRPEAAEARSAI